MAEPIKKSLLNLPLKLILSDNGATRFIAANKNLLRFRLADGTSEYGIRMNSFSPKAIQKMLLVNYISKLEIALARFHSKRQDVMDLSKLIVYSMLYKRFNQELFYELIQCDCIGKHNRSHPTELIDKQMKIPNHRLHKILGDPARTARISKQLLDPIWEKILQNPDFKDEDKNLYILMSEKFLQLMNSYNWYITVFFSKSKSFYQIEQVIQETLLKYMSKAKVAEYISLMLMELALNNENTNIQKYARRLYPDQKDVQAIIAKPEIRAEVQRELEEKNELISILWKIGGGTSSLGKQGQLQITIYNKDDEFQKVKANIEAQMNKANQKHTTLIDFFNEADAEVKESDLGFFYMSCLEDECRTAGIKFESIVNQFEDSGLMVITLVFNF